MRNAPCTRLQNAEVQLEYPGKINDCKARSRLVITEASKLIDIELRWSAP
jgi:hypothetical protein